MKLLIQLSVSAFVGERLACCVAISYIQDMYGVMQGFPDDFQFYGNVHSKHRQIGNAVPVPLAYSLGRQLRVALKETAERQAKNLLAAQMM